jgi:hypothetical protein
VEWHRRAETGRACLEAPRPRRARLSAAQPGEIANGAKGFAGYPAARGFFRPRPAGSGRSSHWEQEHPGGPAAFLDNDVQTILGGRMRNENKEKSQDLQEILAQIERVCRGLIADIERQAQIAEELTQNLPEEKRQAILKNIQETRERLAAYEARLKGRSRGA